MLKLQWKLNGRSVSPNQLARELGRAVQDEAGQRAKAAIARVRCPVHGSSPRNINVSRSGNDLRFRYEFCCERLRQAVNNSMR